MLVMRSPVVSLVAGALLAVVSATSCTDLDGLSASADAADAAAPPPDGSGAQPNGGSACPAGQKRCDGSCVDVDDPSFGCGPETCAPCSIPFADKVKCANAKCAVGTCLPGRADCDGRGDTGCEADLGKAATCGSCTTACGGATPLCAPSGCTATCPPEAPTPCSGSCVDTKTSAEHCGGCGTACAARPNAVGKCTNGTCGVACNTGFSDCDGNPGNGCEPLVRYYADADGDGYGAGVSAGQACSPPAGFVARNGDCNDSADKVHPGVTDFYAEPYVTGSGTASFDYDCSGAESVSPSVPLGSCQPCAVGYLPAVTPRSGPGVDLRCGSTNKSTSCNTGGCVVSTDNPPLGCR